MKYVCCSVKDFAADVFAQPMFVPSRGVAIRAFRQEVTREADNNQLFRNPGDFALYVVGGYDDASGKFDNLESPELLIRGADCKE